jgi:hypothetical protein
MAMGAITAATAAAAMPVRASSAAGIKLALTLLADTDRSLSGSGAPAAPRSSVVPAAPMVPTPDFPTLIAARFAVPPYSARSRRSDRRSRKRD